MVEKSIMNKTILDSGGLMKKIVSFVRDTRNKYNVPKDKLKLYIDLYTKQPTFLDINLVASEGVILKLAKLNSIEYFLTELFENNSFFETINIDGYNVYIELPMVDKNSQINNFSDELERLELVKINLTSKLSDEKFTTNAPKDIVDKEQKKLTDTINKIDSLNSITLMLNCGKELYDLRIRLGSLECIKGYCQYERELISKNIPYECDWFKEVYFEPLNLNDIINLSSKIW